jgi:hypothetical protein
MLYKNNYSFKFSFYTVYISMKVNGFFILLKKNHKKLQCCLHNVWLTSNEFFILWRER